MGAYRKNHPTAAAWRAMWNKQNGQCAICDTPLSTGAANGSAKAMTDHYHTTGVVRGLLCLRCNQGVGVFSDNAPVLLRAFKYLHRSTDSDVLVFPGAPAPAVCIKWLDASNSLGEVTDASDYKEVELLSFGWLVGKTDRGVVIAMDYSSVDGSYRTSLNIPHGMIVDVQVLLPVWNSLSEIAGLVKQWTGK